MKLTSRFMFVLLFVGIFATACYPYVKNPALTQWPTYVPPSPYQVSFAGIQSPPPEACSVRAVDLLGAWVGADVPEKDPFSFTDINGQQCQGTFDVDVLPLFTQANLWYTGALSCRTCHGPDVEVSYARMDLSSYHGILAGMSRDSAEATGEDILAGNNWQESDLYDVLSNGEMPPEQPAGLNPKGPLIEVLPAQ